MLINQEGKINSSQALAILEGIIQTGEIGLFFWHINEEKFEIIEKISGYPYNEAVSLPHFIEKVVIKKDQELVYQDLEAFIAGDLAHYESTFRVCDKSGNIKWIFCKGRRITETSLGVIMYDVTGNKFTKGNDPNTGLLKGRYFMRKLNNSIKHAQHLQRTGALIYIEIDNLLILINKYGFSFANEAVTQFSRKLTKFLGEYDELARFPYEKFMLLLNNVEDVSKVETVSREILEIFKEPMNLNGIHVCLDISLGITLFPEVSTDADELMRFSDYAIGYSRSKGSNKVTFFDSELMESYIRKKNIQNELPNAIVNQELSLVFQPQFNLRTREITGLEVLSRWNSLNLGFVSPAEFIPLAEDSGFIVKIGEWVAEESIKTARKWLDQGFDFNKLSINVSPLEFQQADFQEKLLEKCHRYNIAAERIELEITEGLLFSANETNKDKIKRLISAGFKIALDDFGTGYSNYTSLIEFDFSTLKIDKSLVGNITDERWQYIVKNIIGFRKYMNYNIIAEGVETKEEAEVLLELGCDNIQGYYFSKPLSLDKTEAFLMKHQ